MAQAPVPRPLPRRRRAGKPGERRLRPTGGTSMPIDWLKSHVNLKNLTFAFALVCSSG